MEQVPALIKIFSEDVGENGEAAWRKLQAYPREKLIEFLLTFRNSIPKDDLRQYSIAFTLVNLNYEYGDNVNALTRWLRTFPLCGMLPAPRMPIANR